MGIPDVYEKTNMAEARAEEGEGVVIEENNIC